MKQNLGTTDRVLRFALAFWWLGHWQPNFATNWMNWIIIVIGVIALLESFTAWCWIHTALGVNNKNQ